jgi:hypothetical protein
MATKVFVLAAAWHPRTPIHSRQLPLNEFQVSNASDTLVSVVPLVRDHAVGSYIGPGNWKDGKGQSSSVAIQVPFLLTFRHVSHSSLFRSLSRYRRSWAGPELCRRLFRSPRQPESEYHGQHSAKHPECESAGFLSTNLRRLKSKDIFCTEQQCLSVQCSPSLITIYSPLASGR